MALPLALECRLPRLLVPAVHYLGWSEPRSCIHRRKAPVASSRPSKNT